MTKPLTRRQVSLRIGRLVLAAATLLTLLAQQGLASSGGSRDLPAATAQRAPAQSPPGVSAVAIKIVASGFSQPLQVTHAGDGSGRLFVVERGGLIRIIDGSTVLATPFLDVRSLVTTVGGEQGLLGLAFHPQYASNGRLYVDYTRVGDGATVVARYTVSGTDPNAVDPASATTVLTVTQPYANHNGGQLAFGPDGYLYVGLGDGGGAGDPGENGQDITTLLGSILRLDVDSSSPYAIPPDNPFIAGSGRDEIWDFGLRNPWRFGFDRLTGDLYIGDVGQNAWEEIDFHAAGTPGGLNLGWDCREGSHDYEYVGPCLTADLVDPIAEYSHADGRSVTGGFVYRGQAFPGLQGRYFFADYLAGKIWSMYQTGTSPITWSVPQMESDTTLLISSFGEDESGELYVVDYAGGTIRHLTPGYRVHLPMILRVP